jgi:hypothetical protein
MSDEPASPRRKRTRGSGMPEAVRRSINLLEAQVRRN